MKLLDILARELKAWPDSWGNYCVSSRVSGPCAAWFNHRQPQPVPGGWKDAGSVEMWLSREPQDRKEAVVTRAQWQAAVDAINADLVESSPDMHAQLVGRVTRLAAWAGEGLPPVGIDVEVFAEYSHPRFDRFLNQKVSVIAHDVINGDPVAVFRMPVDGDDTEQDYHAMVAGSFRPIRTPEQIALEARENAVKEMLAVWNSGFEGHVKDGLYALFDAGYCKP